MREQDSLLSQAKQHLGMYGRPNAATRWYAVRHGSSYLSAAWCDMFVSWVADQTGLAKKVGTFAYTPAHVSWFKAKKAWGQKPVKGAIVFFNWRSPGGRPWGTAEHVGIVDSVRSDGWVNTIEGNTGDAVRRKLRNPRYIIGYGYPAYAGDTPKPKPPAGDKYPGKLIRPGDSGPAVRKVKDRLRALGYSEVVAGPNYGPHAVAAIKKLQKSKKLGVDGIVGPKTWKALFG